MAKKLATVIAATGAQGTAVISALVQNGCYKIRALTRRTDSAAAKGLAAKGYEVVHANTSDEASLRAAFAGSDLVFGVTDFNEAFHEPDVGAEEAKNLEIQQGLNIVRAVQATPTVEHFIWSTLPRCGDISGGKIPVPHFDGKGEVQKFIRADSALLAKTTFLFVGVYATNLSFPMFKPILLTSGKYTVIGDYPADTPWVTIGETRRNLVPFVKAIVEQPDRTKNGAIVLATIETIGFEKMLQKWASLHGKEATYTRTDSATYFQLWPKWAEEMSGMLQFWDAHRGHAWSDPDREVMGAKELGIDPSGFVGLDETFKSRTDWL